MTCIYFALWYVSQLTVQTNDGGETGSVVLEKTVVPRFSLPCDPTLVFGYPKLLTILHKRCASRLVSHSSFLELTSRRLSNFLIVTALP